MPKTERAATAPARARVGLPIVPDGSARHPLLLRLPPSPDGAPSRCNNGCRECLTQPVSGDAAAFSAEVRGRHVVLRDREPTLRRDLPKLVRELRARGPASITLLTNGRMLGYAAVTAELQKAGVDRFIVKLFGLDEAAHDEHTRVPGSYKQAVAGVAAARALGVRVLVCFPLLVEGTPADHAAAAAARRARALELTGFDPIDLPEPEIEAHGGDYRYDLMALRGPTTHPLWQNSQYPLAYVNTGPACNIRCVYCLVDGGSDQRLYSREYLERLIDMAAQTLLDGSTPGGAPTIEFIGGDPTLHPDLPALVRRARDRGVPQVTACTNGVLLIRDGYLDDLVAAGLTGIRYSFHDHRPEVANALADVPGLGNRYVEIARMLLSRTDLRPLVNRILMANTVDALGDYLRWLADHNKTGQPIDLALLLPSMRGRMVENASLYPPLAGLREAVVAAVELADTLGIRTSLIHMPACIHPGARDRNAYLHVRTLHVDAVNRTEELVNFEGDARHGEACNGCAAREAGCLGLSGAYFEADRAAAEAWLTPLR
jgi:MoaA/NifB/PqqE/SkfB family radical SAM enzyme